LIDYLLTYLLFCECWPSQSKTSTLETLIRRESTLPRDPSTVHEQSQLSADTDCAEEPSELEKKIRKADQIR